MYKIIYNGIVIDLVKELKYAKYMVNSKRTYLSSRAVANCIMASNDKDRYHLIGVPYPEGSNLKSVTALKITEKEYNDLLSETSNFSNPAIELGIRNLKKAKIEEMRNECNLKILAGLHILLSDGEYHHFAMSIEDQLNLLEIRYLISSGQGSFIYHETGGECREFSADDMSIILRETFKHKQDHLLYFNILKKYINQLQNIDDISKIKYGIKIEN